MKIWRGVLSLGCVVLTGFTGLAQEPPYRLEDDVITAEKREGTSHDAATSVSSVSGDELYEAGYDHLSEASTLIPNLYVSQFNVSRLTFPTIRGVGSGQGNPGVVTYFDDVPQLTFNTVGMPLLDLERLEVLRGPQGTLYGRNALGGVIRAVTRDPGADFRGVGRFGGGTDGRVEGDLSLSGPFENQENLFWGLTLSGREHDGFVTNTAPTATGNKLDGSESRYGRLKLFWTPTDEWDATLTVVKERSTDGSFVLSDLTALRQRPYSASYNYEGGAEREVFGPSLRLRRHGDNISFLSVTSFQSSEISESTDIDFTADASASFTNRTRSVAEDQDQFFQEFRFFSSKDSDYRIADGIGVDWLAGLALWSSDVDNLSGMTFIGLGGVSLMDRLDQRDRGAALFGEATLHLGDFWDFTFGSRIAYEDKEADTDNFYAPGSVGFPAAAGAGTGDESYTEWLPKVSLAYRPNDNWTVYANIERGFKGGGFNIQAPGLSPGTVQTGTAYDSESNWTYETGVKWRSSNKRWQARVAAFFIDWEDMQLTQPVGNGFFFVDNVGEAENYGIEVELEGQLTDQIRVFANVGLTETEFQSYTDPFRYVDVSGNELPNVPAFTWVVGGEWRLQRNDFHYYVRADVSGTGDVWYDSANTEKQQDWTIANLRAGVEYGHVGFEVWTRNAFDEEYVPIAIQVDPANPAAFVGQSGAPQEFGAALTVRF